MLNSLTKKPLVRIIRRETRRIADSWVLIFSTMIAPIVAFLIIIWLFSDGVVRDLPVAVVDQAQTAYSSQVVRLIDATPVCKVKYRLRSMEEAKQMMDVGKIEAVIMLPADLEQKIMKNGAPAIAVYINNLST